MKTYYTYQDYIEWLGIAAIICLGIVAFVTLLAL